MEASLMTVAVLDFQQALYSQFHQQLALVPFLLLATLAERLNGADFEKPHRIMRGRQFAPVTADAEWELSHLPTGCDYLYRHCIRVQQPGTKLELYLEEFRDSLAAMGITYSLRYIRQCFNQLVKAGLIKILKRWIGGIYQVIVRHAGMVENTTTYNGRATEKHVGSDRKHVKTEPQNRIPSFPITEDLQRTAEPLDAAAPENFLAKKEEEVARTESVMPEQTEATWEKKSAPPTPKDISIEGIDPDAESVDEETALVNTEEKEITLALRDAGMLNPQLKALALSFTLLDVQAALALYQQRQQKKEISNPQGFLTNCLRGQWWKEAKPNPTLAQSQFPAELVEWYSFAEKAGIIDAIDLKHLPCYMGELSVRLLNRNRQRPFDPPFILTPWREAMALHSLQDLLDVGEPEIGGLIELPLTQSQRV